MILKGDPEHARQINIALILGLFKSENILSRAQLAKKLNLSKMTVSAIISDLIDDGFISEIGEGKGDHKGGRKPILLKLTENTKYVIGIDVGRTNIAVAIGGISGNIKEKVQIATNIDHSLESILKQLSTIVEYSIATSGIERKKIIGIGFSIGGLINKEKGYIDVSPDFDWKNVPMQQILEQKFKLPVVIDNCTRVMALGEMWLGSAKHIKNFFYVNLGFGLGSSIVMNHSIYENYSEFGHIHITNKPVKCGCGMTGCLEAVASGQAIEREANAKLTDGIPSDKRLTGKDVYNLAVEGNEVAQKILSDSGRYVGRALSLVANIFQPEKIILGGGVTNAGEYLYAPMEREFLSHTMEVLRDSVQIEFSELGNDAGVLGAVALALDTYVFHSKILIRQ
jgi:glucokinase-like ROK family protein